MKASKQTKWIPGSGGTRTALGKWAHKTMTLFQFVRRSIYGKWFTFARARSLFLSTWIWSTWKQLHKVRPPSALELECCLNDEWMREKSREFIKHFVRSCVCGHEMTESNSLSSANSNSNFSSSSSSSSSFAAADKSFHSWNCTCVISFVVFVCCFHYRMKEKVNEKREIFLQVEK